jgi:hypothetical protein
MYSWLRRLAHSLNLQRMLLTVLLFVFVVLPLFTLVFGGKHDSSIRQFAAILAGSVILSIGYSIRYLFQYRLARACVPADDYLTRFAGLDVARCTILRPFGSDGYIYLEEERSANGLLKNYMFRKSTVLEALIAEVAAAEMQIETVCIVDPKVLVVPPGPVFLRAGDGWKRNVSDMLEGSDFVVFIFPPLCEMTTSVEWEVNEALRAGKKGQMLFILPPPDMSGSEASLQTLRALTKNFALLSEVLAEDRARNIVAFYPIFTGEQDRFEVKYWCTDSPHASSWTYRGIIQAAMKLSEPARRSRKEPWA